MLQEILILPYTGAILAIGAFLIVLVILWFLLPFSVFGTKSILRDIRHTQNLILKELKAPPPNTDEKPMPDGERRSPTLRGPGKKED